jgi:serine/threonine protein phosphatase 1
MRILAIGDIHGHLQALDALLDEVQPKPDDLVITLGDYVDRGPDVHGVLDRLIELQSRCKLIPLKGNHDLMMLEARANESAFRDWHQVGGKQTLDSYGVDLRYDNFRTMIPKRHWRFLNTKCRPYYEADTHFFVHAGVEYDIPLAAQSESVLFWEKLDPNDARQHASGKIMVCGHSAQKSGRPLALDHAVCIDTWIYGGGWLTCLDVQHEAYWQANAHGETRMGMLDFRSR